MQKTKLIKNGDRIIVIFDNGSFVQKDDANDELFAELCKLDSEDEIRKLLCPEYMKLIEECKENTSIIENAKKSNLLSFEGDSVYWRDISGLSVPKELVKAILEAEEAKDDLLLETYKNFWTLMSLNPSEECRKNLFWFLNRNGLVISRCGFFVAYRNVDKHKMYTEEDEVYTDVHSHTFTIRIGEMVTMPREECDDRQDVTCSKGLHLGSKDWLTAGYYGTQGLVCLCNPAEVVAVPHEDHYGKLRTCAYLPITKAKFGEDKKVIPYDAKDGFECEYIPKIIYEGLIGTEKDSNYKIIIPDMPGIDRESIADKLLDIARETIINREV